MNVRTGFGAGRSPRAHYHRVNLCPECAKGYRRRNIVAGVVFLGVILAIVVVIVVKALMRGH